MLTFNESAEGRSRDARDTCRRAEERLRVISESALAFAEATSDVARLTEVIARKFRALGADLCTIELLDGQALPPPSASLPAQGSPQALTVPLSFRNQHVGRARLLRSGSGSYTDDQLQLFDCIAEHAALSLINALALAEGHQAQRTAEKLELVLRETNARFARLSESGMIGILVTDLSGAVVEINDALLAMVAYGRDELLSGRVKWRELTPPEWYENDERTMQRLRTSRVGRLREREYIRKDGQRVPVLIVSAIVEGNNQRVTSFVVDLSERHPV